MQLLFLIFVSKLIADFCKLFNQHIQYTHILHHSLEELGKFVWGIDFEVPLLMKTKVCERCICCINLPYIFHPGNPPKCVTTLPYSLHVRKLQFIALQVTLLRYYHTGLEERHKFARSVKYVYFLNSNWHLQRLQMKQYISNWNKFKYIYGCLKKHQDI